MSSSGKMSLVVLRSWNEAPPKVRAIAPPDDDRAIYVPDHKGRFVTEEVKEDPRLFAGDHPPRCASSASQYKEVSHRDGNDTRSMSLLPESSFKKTKDGIIYRKTPLQRCFAIANANRHSYSGAGASQAGLSGNLAKTSSSLHLPLQAVNSFGKESLSSRPDSAAASPDNPDASSLEYTPPSSPVNGRYRNLGPELAATIPKRNMRNSWIAEVKSRWNNKSGNSIAATTHPSSRVSSRHSAGSSKRTSGSGSTLKSYGSSPSLIYRKNKSTKGVGKRTGVSEDEEEEEEGDYFHDDNFIIRGKNEATPHHHRRSSLQRLHSLVDEDAEEVIEKQQQKQKQQPFFNPLYKFSHSNSNSILQASSKKNDSEEASSEGNGNVSLLRSHFKSAETVNARSSTNLLHRCTASGITLSSVDDDSQSDRSRSSLGYPPSNNSGNTSYSPSPPLTSKPSIDHIYSSLTDIQHEVLNRGGRLDPFKLGDSGHTSDVVLVEVIRKAGKSSGNGNPSDSGKIATGKNSSGLEDKYSNLEKFGSVELIQTVGSRDLLATSKPKRHSAGEIDQTEANSNKATLAVKAEATPGKVARLKESLKRFGRFGRSNTDKLIRAHSDSGFSTDDVNGGSSDFTKVFGETNSKRHSRDAESNYENPKEIIITSLEDTEKLGITVKPAPRRRSKPSEELLAVSSSPENIYALPSHTRNKSHINSASEDTQSDQTFSSPSATPSPQHSVEEETNVTLTDQKAQVDKNLMKQEQSSVPETNSKNDRVSLQAATTKEDAAIIDKKGNEETRIPHLEFEKGDEENSTSHDDSCSNSSRAESLTYSSTSHEQDRSMPQQMIVQHLLPKVDIVNGDATSIDSNSTSDTLNCEVTPVIRKRTTFDREGDEDELSSLANITDAEKDGGEIYAFVVNKQRLVRQISNSSVESIASKKLTDEDKEKEESLSASKTNTESQETTAENKPNEQQTSTSPVTLNEPSENSSDIVSSNSNNMNFGRTTRNSSRLSSREIYNLQKEQSGQANHNLYNGIKVSSASDNGPKGPEIIASKVEEMNGTGKYENGTASVQVPVQAVNRHVLGYGIASVNDSNNGEQDSCNHILNGDQQLYNASIASTISNSDSEWNRSSLRTSLKGFCEDMLQPREEKLSILVPDVVEAVINFDEDTSSIEQDDERENSIEYISVANVKVNKGLDKLHPRDVLPSCVIALDLGSRGSGYSYWIKEESEFVRIGNVDGGSSCPASHKAPSWVMFDDLYLDGDEEGESSDSIRPGFGFQALDKYLTDDAHGQLSWKWREHFHEVKSYPYTLDSKASDDDLIFMMKSTIRHYGRQALEQISQRKKGAPPGPTVILIAIPSTFNQRARQLVRDAALESGVLNESDSVALIEDSCATGLYSLHALKSKLNKESNSKVTQMTYLSVDCGAAYLHFSGFEYTEGKLRHLMLCRSDPLIDSPESLFEAELATVFTPTYIFNYQNKYKAGWLKLMTEFEHAKNRYDPLSKQNYYVFVPSSFVDHFRRFTNMEVEDSLESSDMVWNKTGALGIPAWKMQRFLQPLLDYINDKIVTSMKKHKFDHLVVTGGRAGAKFYVDAIRAAAKGFGATLHVPKEYNAAVLQGSTISVTNLAPRLVIKSRFSIGVGVMTPFSEEIHPEEKRVMRDGKSWCADVWDTLVSADQELELNRVIIKRSYVGAQPGQSLLVLPLFKSPDEPKFVTESSVQKCCELKFSSGQRAWQEVELVLVCRPSELLIKAMDGGVMKSYVVVDFSD